MSSQAVCKACLLLEGLNRGLPGLGVSKTKKGQSRRAQQPLQLQMEEQPPPQQQQQQQGTKQQQPQQVEKQQRHQQPQQQVEEQQQQPSACASAVS